MHNMTQTNQESEVAGTTYLEHKCDKKEEKNIRHRNRNPQNKLQIGRFPLDIVSVDVKGPLQGKIKYFLTNGNRKTWHPLYTTDTNS